MSADGTVLIFFDDPTITLDDAMRVLDYQPPTRDGDALFVAYGMKEGDTDIEITVGISDEPHVVIEAAELAERAPEVATCKRRFEIIISDIEASLNEYNVMFEYTARLQDLVKGVMHYSWNGNITRWDHEKNEPIV